MRPSRKEAKDLFAKPIGFIGLGAAMLLGAPLCLGFGIGLSISEPIEALSDIEGIILMLVLVLVTWVLLKKASKMESDDRLFELPAKFWKFAIFLVLLIGFLMGVSLV